MISAIILAAGESKRMGQPKMLLPWGKTTILGQVISTFQEAGLEDIVVVTGGAQAQVSEIAERHGARSIFNELYANGEMLSSLQCGLQLLVPDESVEAALIGLGDQPQIQAGCVKLIHEAFQKTKAPLIVPSFQRRRGHPWLVAKPLWEELMMLQPPDSPRDFLNRHAAEIQYVEVDTLSILADLDTPQDYKNSLPDS